MKKSFVIIGLILIVCIGALAIPAKETAEYDYLRLHIRANSNLEIDQNIKYKIKDFLVEFLSPYFCSVSSKQEAIEIVNDMSPLIKANCDKLLKANGFSYVANIKVNNEYFPTRTYNNTTLESGYYDAVVVELGSAVGDNWWCVMYPPLCFVNKNETNMQIKYKSKIVEIIQKIFG